MKMSASILATLAMMTGVAAPAASQSPATLCPSHDMGVYRMSRIKPGGSLAGFQKAVEDNARWYPDHGYTGDRIMWARVIDRDMASGAMRPSPDTVVTLHMHSSDVAAAKHDAAWTAFVAEYDANSEVVSTTVACTQP